MSLFISKNFQAVTTDLCNDNRKEIEQIEDIQNRIEEKRNQIEKTSVLNEKDMRQWLSGIKNEISKIETEEIKEMKIVVNETGLKAARDCLIEKLRPVKSETTSFASELICNIQNELNEHYDFEENSKHI